MARMGGDARSWPTGAMTTTAPPESDQGRVSAAAVAAHTPTDRNRAVDFYRAAAMAVVAVGHWLGMVAVLDRGELVGGNLLDFSPEYGWITWIGQVMPLFFFVGGFASATSLRSAERKGVRSADWIATRLRRMVTPAAALAGFWAVGLVVGAAFGGFGVVSIGAAGAAIPLWFLANYTIDTALAPFTFRWFRARPRVLVGGLVVLFGIGEAARFAGIPYVPELNWVIGWLGFHVAGFAWQDGRLPTGKALTALAATFWALALAAVNLGPWPAVMLHHGGLEHSPTHPPSTALILFGLAYSFTAAAFAPAVTRWLERSTRAWKLTIAAKVVAMSVYLWHMTAAVLVVGVAYLVGLLPSVEPGTTAWWWTKIPFLLLNLAVLIPLVKRVAPIEQKALLGGTTEWRWGIPSMLATAALLSLSVKAWSSPEAGVLIAGIAGTMLIWRLALAKPKARARQAQS
ncbi:acyltransferase family protein [soil metagenome]